MPERGNRIGEAFKGEETMRAKLTALAAAALTVVCTGAGLTGAAQAADQPKHGGIIRFYHRET